MKKVAKKKSVKKVKQGESIIDKLLVGKKVVVRAKLAGLHAGIVVASDVANKAIIIKDSCRIWDYYTRDTSGSLSDIGAYGLKKPYSQHHIGAQVPSVTIVEPDGFEHMEMTDAAFQTILDACCKVKNP